MNTLKVWMHVATPEERERMAEAVGTTVKRLYSWAGRHRRPKLEAAARIERKSREMAAVPDSELPEIFRSDLLPGCAECEYARRCLGPKLAGRAEFMKGEIVND